MTINIWLSRELPGYFPASVVGSPIHWIFKHPQNRSDKEQIGYALVISAADRWIELSNEEVGSAIVHFFPDHNNMFSNKLTMSAIKAENIVPLVDALDILAKQFMRSWRQGSSDITPNYY